MIYTLRSLQNGVVITIFLHFRQTFVLWFYIFHIWFRKNASVSVLNSNVFSISWKHNYHLLKNPCEEKFPIFTVDGARKFLSKPITKKEPITVDIMKKLYDHYGVSSDLSDLRIYCMFSLAFAGFLRFNELVNIRFADLTFSDSIVQIFIPKSKTDIFRQGHKLLIARTGKETCPVVCLENHIRISKIANKEEFLFRALQYKKGKHLRSTCNKHISYSRVRELFRTSLDKIGLDKSKFGLHSLRSGGATSAANYSVADRLFKTHGRWRSENAKDGYVQDDVRTKLSVSLNLGIYFNKVYYIYVIITCICIERFVFSS